MSDTPNKPMAPRQRSRRRQRTFPVTVTQLPTVRCAVCDRTLAYRPGPGQASATLNEHYDKEHSLVTQS